MLPPDVLLHWLHATPVPAATDPASTVAAAAVALATAALALAAAARGPGAALFKYSRCGHQQHDSRGFHRRECVERFVY